MIKYDLQFFAKDGPGGQKTEPATPKKLEDARKKGQVAKSKDLSGSVLLLAFFVLIKIYVKYLGRQFMSSFHETYTRIGDLSGASDEYSSIGVYFKNILQQNILDMLVMLLPILAVAFVLGFVMDIIQVKWKPTGETLKPKFDKFNPVNGIKRIFNVKTIAELIKQIVVLAVCVIVTYNKLKSKIGMLFNLYDITLQQAVVAMGDLIIDLGITISVIYLIIGVADYIFEKWKFKDDMKMTKQELKDEWKDTEGSPEVKNKQRRRMQEASRRRMMQAVPEADVVITNPTHFAVALKYEQDSGKAPVVVAKGEDYLAQKIKEKARECDVEIVENKPLARMLYYNVDLGTEIPQELYQAVAEVLAFVWKLKHKI